MQWFSRLFGSSPGRLSDTPVFSTATTGHVSDLEAALARGSRMLQTLTEAYGDESVITRQQSSYVETLRRELSASRHTA